MMYDLIGDIHGQANELEALLEKLDYRHSGGCYRYDNRKVIFLGDFIDRGPHQKRVLTLIRSMIDGGAAKAVMGNHEYNAIAFFTPKFDGGNLRERNNKNIGQHRAFLDAYAGDEDEWREMIEWFKKTLPLWLDLKGLRVVHACWDPIFIKKIAEECKGQALLTDELLLNSSDRSTWQFKAIETLLKGKEIQLPDGAYFKDKDGTRRHEIRVRWWGRGATYREAYIGPESALTHIPDDPIQGDHMVEYGHDEKPVFLGHYWMEGDPTPIAPNIACLDYSVAKPGGKLVAYRWDGEQQIDPTKFVFSERVD
jgi:hypothetical protein